MVNYWHCNVQYEEHRKYMINNKRAHIGLGSDYPGSGEYNYKIRELKPRSTYFQNKKCKDKIKKGDIIFLYQNKIGYTHYGIYNGIIYRNNQTLEDKLPKWDITEKTDGYCVDEWLIINNSKPDKYALRGTLQEIKNTNKINRKDIIEDLIL